MGSPAARRSPSAYRRVGSAVLISFFISFALGEIARRCWAEWELDRAKDSTAMEAACRLDAGNDENWARWARQLEQEGRSGLPGWQRASAANPR